MHFGILEDLLADPRSTLIFLLLAMPGRLLALSCHEAAHAWVADRCGDPTARMLGRVTLNPLKHLDPVGLLCMLFLGIGWAKPVPVNPRNYRNYRKDDLLVSVAGVTMNLILFLLGGILMYVILGIALSAIPMAEAAAADSALMRATIGGTPALIGGGGAYWYDLREVVRYGYSASEMLIEPMYGSIAGSLYTMLVYFVLTNISLAVFNLIPIPPLDGYHVLNDMVLRRTRLFASAQAQRISTVVMLLALWSGALGKVLNFIIYDGVLEGIGRLAQGVFRLLGIL